jgi:hypothetical protein
MISGFFGVAARFTPDLPAASREVTPTR